MLRTRTVYAINRYYSPDTGRFTTHDPLTELDRPERLNQPQGLNLYPYVMGGPTRYTDPDGLDWIYYQGNGGWSLGWFDRTANGKNERAVQPNMQAEVSRDGWFNGKSRKQWVRTGDKVTLLPGGDFVVNSIAPTKTIHSNDVTKAEPKISLEERQQRRRQDDAFDERRRFGPGDVFAIWYLTHFAFTAAAVAATIVLVPIVVAAHPLIFNNGITTLFTETALPGVIQKAGSAIGSAIGSFVRWIGIGDDIVTILPNGAPRVSPGIPPTRPSPRGDPPATTATETSATESSAMTGSGASRTASVPGLDRPFSPAIAEAAPNAAVLRAMPKERVHIGMDCSEIADDLLNVAGGKGRIIRVDASAKGDLKLLEYGKVEGGMVYHEAYCDGRYVFDPRTSPNPILLEEWIEMIRKLNPGASIK